MATPCGHNNAIIRRFSTEQITHIKKQRAALNKRLSNITTYKAAIHSRVNQRH